MKEDLAVKKVKLFIGFIFSGEETYLKAKIILRNSFGEFDYESITLPFNHTKYYQREFGPGLKRKFLSFQRLIHPKKLSEVKIITNRLEEKLSLSRRRQINIDPGILSLSKVVLATTKDYKHRIYIDKGIYAEVTLYYQNKSFCPWEWTYPDYKTLDYLRIFNEIRNIYHCQIK